MSNSNFLYKKKNGRKDFDTEQCPKYICVSKTAQQYIFTGRKCLTIHFIQKISNITFLYIKCPSIHFYITDGQQYMFLNKRRNTCLFLKKKKKKGAAKHFNIKTNEHQ